MRAVDTNVLVRLIARDDARQAVSPDRWVEKGAWVSILALAEATWVLPAIYERRATKITSAVEMLLNHKDLVLQDPEVVALDIYSLSSTGFQAFPLYCLMTAV